MKATNLLAIGILVVYYGLPNINKFIGTNKGGDEVFNTDGDMIMSCVLEEIVHCVEDGTISNTKYLGETISGSWGRVKDRADLSIHGKKYVTEMSKEIGDILPDTSKNITDRDKSKYTDLINACIEKIRE